MDLPPKVVSATPAVVALAPAALAVAIAAGAQLRLARTGKDGS